MLGGIASSLIGLAYEGISSFLHHKRHKALKKAVHTINKKTDIQCSKIYHLEDTDNVWCLQLQHTDRFN